MNQSSNTAQFALVLQQAGSVKNHNLTKRRLLVAWQRFSGQGSNTEGGGNGGTMAHPLSVMQPLRTTVAPLQSVSIIKRTFPKWESASPLPTPLSREIKDSY